MATPPVLLLLGCAHRSMCVFDSAIVMRYRAQVSVATLLVRAVRTTQILPSGFRPVPYLASGPKRMTRSSHESLLLPIVPVNLVGAYSLPPYLPSSVSVPIVLCTLNSRRWNQTFGARWFSPVYVRTVCINLVLCGSGIVLSSHSIP